MLFLGSRTVAFLMRRSYFSWAKRGTAKKRRERNRFMVNAKSLSNGLIQAMGSIAEPKKSVMRKCELRSWRRFRESRWAKNERNREGGDEQKNGLDGMAITERGVRRVVNEREEEYDGSEWKRKRIATKEEHDYAKDCCQSEAGIEEEDGTDEKGVWGAKITTGENGGRAMGR